MFKCCIVDLDGTLLDTVASLAHSANRAMEKFGLPPQPVERYKYFAGDGQIELIKRCVIASGDTYLTNFYKVLHEYIKLFEKDCIYEVKPYDGITELTCWLKANNIKIAVLTNKQHDNALYVLNSVFGENYFDFILGQDDTHEKKPSRTGVDIILRKMNVKEDECIYIGDTNTDMKTGKNAGLFTVGVTWGFRDYEELKKGEPQAIIDSPLQLRDIINRKD